MSNILKIEGKPRDFEAITPSAVGFFFGNNSYLMNIQRSEDVAGTTEETTIAVRFDTFLRCPTISNMNVIIHGEFDKDHILRVNQLEVVETGLHMSGVRRFTPIVGLALLILVPCLFYLLLYLVVEWIERIQEKAAGLARLIVNEPVANAFATSLGWVVIFLIVTPPFIFLIRTALPSLLEGLARLAGRLACYRTKPTSADNRERIPQRE